MTDWDDEDNILESSLKNKQGLRMGRCLGGGKVRENGGKRVCGLSERALHVLFFDRNFLQTSL